MSYPIFDGNELTQKQLIAGYLMAGIPLFFGFYMAVWGFGQIADKKAENPENLIRGCMYFHSKIVDKTNHTRINFYVDGVFGSTLKSIQKVFYSNIKNQGFESFSDFKSFISSNGSDVCYEVSYVKLDLLIFKKVFIYDYHGIKSDN